MTLTINIKSIDENAFAYSKRSAAVLLFYDGIYWEFLIFLRQLLRISHFFCDNYCEFLIFRPQLLRISHFSATIIANFSFFGDICLNKNVRYDCLFLFFSFSQSHHTLRQKTINIHGNTNRQKSLFYVSER